MANEMPKRIELLEVGAQENIRFIKKQEWVFTSSVLTAYGSLIAASRYINFVCAMKIILLVAIALSLVFSWLVFDGLKRSLQTSRDVSKLIFEKYYPENEKREIKRLVPKTRSYFDRCGIFIWLFVILLFGAGIAAYAIVYPGALNLCP